MKYFFCLNFFCSWEIAQVNNKNCINLCCYYRCIRLIRTKRNKNDREIDHNLCTISRFPLDLTNGHWRLAEEYSNFIFHSYSQHMRRVKLFFHKEENCLFSFVLKLWKNTYYFLIDKLNHIRPVWYCWVVL